MLTPLQAIDATTRIAAEACKISERAGAIRPGMDADLLVVDGNPLERISDLWRVRQVFTLGRAVIRDARPTLAMACCPTASEPAQA